MGVCNTRLSKEGFDVDANALELFKRTCQAVIHQPGWANARDVNEMIQKIKEQRCLRVFDEEVGVTEKKQRRDIMRSDVEPVAMKIIKGRYVNIKAKEMEDIFKDADPYE
eukprot:Awhi_evm1s6896